jgi:predicted amidohydrolase
MPRRLRAWALALTFLIAAVCARGACGSEDSPSPGKTPDTLRIALLHMDSRPGKIERNRRLIERAIRQAAAEKADWLVTPELAESGYVFAADVGLDWVEAFPGKWIESLAGTARRNRISLFVGIPERDRRTGKLYNSTAVIDAEGHILGTNRKFHVIPGASEGWATPEPDNRPFLVDGVTVGILVCADAAAPDLSAGFAKAGTQILLSPANWPPFEDMGPSGQWEARTRETGLPLVVANRTGREPALDFRKGESVLVYGGKRRLSFAFEKTHLIFIDWDRKAGFAPAGTRALADGED